MQVTLYHLFAKHVGPLQVNETRKKENKPDIRKKINTHYENLSCPPNKLLGKEKPDKHLHKQRNTVQLYSVLVLPFIWTLIY